MREYIKLAILEFNKMSDSQDVFINEYDINSYSNWFVRNAIDNFVDIQDVHHNIENWKGKYIILDLSLIHI